MVLKNDGINLQLKIIMQYLFYYFIILYTFDHPV